MDTVYDKLKKEKENILLYLLVGCIFSLSIVKQYRKKNLGYEPRPLACTDTFYVLIKSSFTV